MQEADQDIIDLNLSWLFKAREMANADHRKAAIVLGLDEALATRLSHCSIEDLRTLAHSGVMLFHPRFHPKLWREMIQSGNGSSLAVRLQTLLMAAEEASGR